MAFKTKIKSKLARGSAITAGAVSAALAGTVLAGVATAGADSTFLAAETQLGDWLAGSGGRIITLIALGYAAAGAIARMSIGTILVPAGIGLLVGIGGPIVLTAGAAELPDAPMQIEVQDDSASMPLLTAEGS